MKTKLVFIILIILFSQYSFSQIDLTTHKYKMANRVVSFEYKSSSTLDNLGNDSFEYIPFATGFFINKSGKSFLITCKHVIDGVLTKYLGELIFRIPYYNKTKEEITTIRITSNIKDEINKNVLFSKDTCYDVCVIDFKNLNLDVSNLKDNESITIEYGTFPQENQIDLKDTLNETDNVYFMGYPFGLSGKTKNYLIYRKGIISAIIDGDYEHLNNISLCGKHYLINSESYGGDSGSPVLIENQKYLKLIGILGGQYFTGLSIVEPIDEVFNIISDYTKRNKQK